MKRAILCGLLAFAAIVSLGLTFATGCGGPSRNDLENQTNNTNKNATNAFNEVKEVQ